MSPHLVILVPLFDLPNLYQILGYIIDNRIIHCLIIEDCHFVIKGIGKQSVILLFFSFLYHLVKRHETLGKERMSQNRIAESYYNG